MAKNNSAKKAIGSVDHEFAALDKAVSELSKRTSALLSGASDDSKAEKKPILPKKKSQVAATGKSFDIIKGTGRSSAKPAQLKVAVSSSRRALPEATEGQLLLPDHAVKSYNEQPDSVEKEVSKDPAVTPTPEIISRHKSKLKISTASPASLEQSTEVEVESSAQPHQDPIIEASAASEPLSFDSDPEEVPEVPVGEAVVPEDDAKEASVVDVPVLDEPKKSEGQGSTEDSTGEVFAHNLVQQIGPSGYKPHKNQQQMAVFDTNEYHAELHDWSKLSHRNSTAKIMLLFLLVTALGVIGYIAFSGLQIPFIS